MIPRVLAIVLLGRSIAMAVEIPGDVKAILESRCLSCHSTEKQKGDLDLESSDLPAEPQVWERVLEQIEIGEMPPKKEGTLSVEESGRFTGWVRGELDEIAMANAGDPGPVVLRRLSNREYTYTLRDLTGVDSLDPAGEFPIDGAAGEGFTNVGAALVMSPALLTKYLDAAKKVAAHAVLLPEGIRFSPSDSPLDWTEETLTRIRSIYDRYTESGPGNARTQQGIALETGTGSGLLPLSRYLEVLQGRGNADGLSPKYLERLGESLRDDAPSLLFDPLRAAFREKSLTSAGIAEWQRVLWRFASVGHIGKENGPKAWQEPINPLVSSQELRLKWDPKQMTSLHLVTSDAGDGTSGDEVEWVNPRFVIPGQADRPVGGSMPMRAKAPSVIKVAVPTGMPETAGFVVTCRLVSKSEGSVQMRVMTQAPGETGGLIAGDAASALAKGDWSDNNLLTEHTVPVIVNEGSEARRRFEAEFDSFRTLFPIALCYHRIVPVDEVVTLTLYHREDDPLKRLFLDEVESLELDRLWDELLFVSEAPLKQVDVFEQLYQYATQDAKPSAFEPMREPILKAAADFRRRRLEVEPRQVEAVVDFAGSAWRRPLDEVERMKLRELHATFRSRDLDHADALRLLLARVLVSPDFLYRGEVSAPGLAAAPVNDFQLATRLSYFLWSSTPDAELLALAAAGKLGEPGTLAAQARRMMRDGRIRRLATEFGCQWLHVRDVETLDEKSDRHFPGFVGLRDDMQEEVSRFFIDLFQGDRSVLSLLDADHTFVNAALADHYGIEVAGDEWRRIEGVRDRGRGGILGFAATLAKHSGASRTSPILRGTWISEVILGDKLPDPPTGVPVLPEVTPVGLTERQLTERHSSDERCAGCHKRVDPYGFALEGFDAIGRARTEDTAGLAIDTKTSLPDGTPIEGLAGLREWLLEKRGDEFLRQFSRKLLGYALGRGVQLSDQPLLDEIVAALRSDGHRAGIAVDRIVGSPQFRERRGRDFVMR